MRITAAIIAVAASLCLAVTPRALGQARGSVGVTGAGGSGTSGASANAAAPATRAGRLLETYLNTGTREAGSYSGAEVVDLNTGQTLYSHDATTGRLPASVEKLYTTTTALIRFGPNAGLTTSVLGQGTETGGTFRGTLYLRGGGDPTFGSAAFDEANYGTGATMQRLVANLSAATGTRAFEGNIVADESFLDSVRGTPATGAQPSIYVEGELSGLAYNRGWATSDGTAFDQHPALEAGQQFLAALQADGVRVNGNTPVSAALTPSTARSLTAISSPPMWSLIALTNTPSDNFFAEMLVKDIGARFGSGGTTAAGAAVVSAQMAQSFGIHPRLNDGSGLSRYDLTTPAQLVALLRQMAGDPQFTNSLAVAGETGTLQDEMQGTYAQGRCRGKTGSLHDVSNVVGYCHARDGHTLAFAFLMNGINPDYAQPIQDQMQVALARYDG
jgi:D-alanyl-D-alanine carboxypeptidase/D-alanyl-D-alanine-endopeptidase (penicillin-binding protein 4)